MIQDSSVNQKSVSTINVVLAFAIVYIVWGSTYFFIQKAIHDFPPFILGGLRFFLAALIMLIWCVYKKEKLFTGSQIKHAAIGGLLLLFIGNGAVIWVEQYMPSAVVAIMVSSSPLWFVLLDKPKWSENLNSKATITGLLIGFLGIALLFYKSIGSLFSGETSVEAGGLLLVTLAAASWAGGSLYSKYYNSESSAIVNTTWQMFSAGAAFSIGSLIMGEPAQFSPASVSSEAWWALAYLVIMGSIAGFSAYVWLLKVRPATQVSTYAYVNPVVAVLLGVLFAGEEISWLQIAGLAVILISVMLINFAKYRKRKAETSAGNI
ncbi:EamA family transporter [Paradesertivirga mongoliensis]|uniref:EamA family transporter n=1 Tax=Paradesertivirga mongoliensis TaxID=2100740 RepID=A0ABW4ZMC5_9SPHI|nr:EamA family transporter [Pedobacter mongoliensis]